MLAALKSKPLSLAPGADDATAEHALLPRLRLLHQQHNDLGRRIGALLEQLTAPVEEQPEHRDTAAEKRRSY